MYKNKGITLIEVLVLITIVGILTGLVCIFIKAEQKHSATATTISARDYDSAITFYGVDFIKLYEAKYGRNALANKSQLDDSFYFYQNGKHAK